MADAAQVPSCAGAVRHVLGVPIHALTMSGTLDVIHEAIVSRRRLLIGVVNAAKIVNMKRDAMLRDSVLASDVVVADGQSVVWASRVLGQPLPERVAGIDLMMELFRAGNNRGYRVFCLGATKEVIRAVGERLQHDYPRLKLVGVRDGYFSEEQEQEVAEEIGRARPDILLVGMTSPKKERFLARWADVMDVPVCHGVGGSFDVYAGRVKRAPKAWQRLGIEWLYRIVQEPRRMWRRYLVTNTLFGVLLARELVEVRLLGQRPPAAEA